MSEPMPTPDASTEDLGSATQTEGSPDSTGYLETDSGGADTPVAEPQSEIAQPSGQSAGFIADDLKVVAEEPEETDEVEVLKAIVAERTDDLQRLQAEYANYKKRVDRDRALAREKGIEDVVEDLMPVFDAIEQAFAHEDASVGFKQIVDLLTKAANKNGLYAYGEVGEAFDPHIHEALMQRTKDGVTEPIIDEIFQKGFRLNDRVLRAARVVVAMPLETEPDAATGENTE